MDVEQECAKSESNFFVSYTLNNVPKGVLLHNFTYTLLSIVIIESIIVRRQGNYKY